jgi:hypothetical protein
MLINWPRRRFGLAMIPKILAVIVLSSIVVQLILFTKAMTWPLLFIIPMGFVPSLIDRLLALSHVHAVLLRPVFIAIVGAGLSAISVFLTWFMTPVETGGY